MPGRTTGDNRFGPSSFVVGPVLGDGCNYLTIQEAINDAATAGGGQVLIRGGTYTEDLVLGTNVNLIGVDVSGFGSDVIIIGNHTYTGNGVNSFEAISFQCGAGTDVFNITATAPFVVLQFSNCDIDSSLVSNGNGVVINSSASVCAIVATDTRVRADLNCFQLDGFTNMVFNGTCTSTNGNVVLATSAFQVRYEDSFAAANVIGTFDLQGGGTLFCNHCRLQSQEEAFAISGASQVQCTNCVIQCDAASGFFAAGVGTLLYSDVSNSGAAIVIDPGLSVTSYDWKPYATAQPSATASGDRGTAQFNSADFTVVDGFVSLAGGAGTPSLAPYIVGTTGVNDFSSIQAAINQAVTDGASNTNPKNIYIKPTNTGYTESLTLSPGVNLIGMSDLAASKSDPATGSPTMSVQLTGDIQFGDGNCTVQNIQIIGALTPPFRFSNPSGTAAEHQIINCYFNDPTLSVFTYNSNVTHAYVKDCNLSGQQIFSSLGGTGSLHIVDSRLLGDTVSSDGNVDLEIQNSTWVGSIDDAVTHDVNAYNSSISTTDAKPWITTASQINLNLVGCDCDTGGAAFLVGSPILCLARNSTFPQSFGGNPSPISGSWESLQCASNITNDRNELFRATDDPSTFLRSYSTRIQKVLETVGAGATTIATIPVPAQTAITINVQFTIFRFDFVAARGGIFLAVGRRDVGGATLAASSSLSNIGDAALAAATISAVASGNNILIQANGIAATTIRWNTDINVVHQGDS